VKTYLVKFDIGGGWFIECQMRGLDAQHAEALAEHSLRRRFIQWDRVFTYSTVGTKCTGWNKTMLGNLLGYIQSIEVANLQLTDKVAQLEQRLAQADVFTKAKPCFPMDLKIEADAAGSGQQYQTEVTELQRPEHSLSTDIKFADHPMVRR
jgi:hypothetical protein